MSDTQTQNGMQTQAQTQSDTGHIPPSRPVGRWGKLIARFKPLLILVAALGLAFLLVISRAPIETAPVEERAWPIAAIVVAHESLRPALQVFGSISAGREVDIRAHVAGDIIQVSESLRNGGTVREGDALLRIDPFDYQTALDEAEIRLAEARARLDELETVRTQDGALLGSDKEQARIAERDFMRAQTLRRENFVAQKTLDDKKNLSIVQEKNVQQRKSGLAIQEARIKQQKGAIERLEISALRAERNLTRTLLRAPFDGFLYNVTAGKGRYATLNEPVARLVGADALEVRFTLSGAQFGRMSSVHTNLKGTRIEVVWRVGGKSFTFPATITRTGAQISTIIGGVDVFAVLANQTLETPLRPGAFVEVHLPDRRYEDVVRLPRDALHENNTVYAIIDGRLTTRTVEVIGEAGQEVFVRGGVEDGERVLATDFPEAGTGVKVNIVREHNYAQSPEGRVHSDEIRALGSGS